MTDQPSVELQLDAVNMVPGLIFDLRPVLYVRCHEQKLDVFITTGTVLNHDDRYERAGYENGPDATSVRIRWGSGAPEEGTWLRSTDYTAAFAPDPAALLNQLLAVPDMRFEFQPFDAAARVAIFNARGLDLHISKLKAACQPPRESPSVHDSGTGIAPAADEVFMEAVVEEKPNVLSGPKVVYPDLLRRARIEGRVIVQAIIDTTGRAEPNSVKILQSPNPGFDQNAKNYVLKALFRPARVHGRAVRVLMQVPIDFTMNGR